MAKIYETEKDVRRDGLEKTLRTASALQSIGAETSTFSGFATIFAYCAKHLIPEGAKSLFGGSMRKNTEMMAPVFVGFTLAGIATAVAGFFVKKRTTAEIAHLGTEEPILPAQAQDYINTKSDYAKQILAQQTATQNNALGL